MEKVLITKQNIKKCESYFYELFNEGSEFLVYSGRFNTREEGKKFLLLPNTMRILGKRNIGEDD